MKWLQENVSAQQFAAISAELQRRTGLELSGHQGEIERSGFRVQYSYDEAAQVLRLELKDNPWYVPESVIESRVKEYLEGPGREFLRS